MGTTIKFYSLFILLYIGLYAQEVDTQFLNIAEGKEAIVDESMEVYFSILESVEMQAKTKTRLNGNLEEQRKKCREIYQKSILDFTSQEKNAIDDCVKKVHKKIMAIYPKFATYPWRFIKIKSIIEGGMPHTRGNYIVFPEDICNYYTLHKSNPFLEVLLLHEQIHVVQRNEPKKFAKLYKKWGFVKLGKRNISSFYQKYQIVNPDGIYSEWALKNNNVFMLPLLTLKEMPKPQMPQDMLMIIATGKIKDNIFTAQEYTPLMRTQSYVEAFPFSVYPHIYHPNEVCAGVFPLLVLSQDDTSKYKIQTQKHKKLFDNAIDWFKENYGK